MPYLADRWNSFQADAIPPDTEPHTSFALKGAFYSGVSVALMALANEGVSFDELLAGCKAYANETNDHSNNHH